ncbi:MAG: BRO family protein [Fusobacteriaceae bacterium]
MLHTNTVGLQVENSTPTQNNKLQIINSQVFGEFKYILIDEEPYFVARHICEALEYTDITSAYRKLDDDEKLNRKISVAGQNRDVVLVNESGLYSLILGSTKPEAKKFKKWVTSEVLPSIRKNGMYATEVTVDKMLSDPDFAISLLTKLKEEKANRIKVEQEKAQLLHSNKLYTSTELAKECNFKSAIQLNEYLHSKKIQFKQSGTWVLYSDYSNRGWTSIKQTVLDSGKIVYDRKWTGMGREAILNLINKSNAKS